MEAKAKQTDIKMTARKLRRVINEVRGKSVKEAQDMLRFMPYFAARVVEKNLKAAVANAQEKYGVGAESLKISEIFADESVTYKRARTRAQGRMYSRLKRTSHLTLKVSDIVKKVARSRSQSDALCEGLTISGRIKTKVKYKTKGIKNGTKNTSNRI